MAKKNWLNWPEPASKPGKSIPVAEAVRNMCEEDAAFRDSYDAFGVVDWQTEPASDIDGSRDQSSWHSRGLAAITTPLIATSLTVFKGLFGRDKIDQ